MWWAYGYVESLSQLEAVIQNLVDWTSERGICFLPICVPEEIGAGNIKLPYSQNVAEYGGIIRFEGVIWSWFDGAEKLHRNMVAPQPEYLIALFEKYFNQVEIIESPLFQAGKTTAIIARSKKQKNISQTTAKIEISTPSKFLSSFFKTIRSQDWWLYKIPPLLAIAYAELLLLDPPVSQSILTVSALLFSIACVAAYGHIVNDSFDIEVDRQVGKSNSMAQFSPWQRALFCLALIVIGFSLPILMHFGTLPIVLLGINYLLPTAYSAPPFRLKEKGILGILSDAAGAHTIPTLFIATTFSHLVGAPTLQATELAITATTWAFFAGVRGILLHQIWDRDNDINSGISTFVTQFELESIRSWINRFIFPCEIATFGGLVVVLSQFLPSLLVFLTVYVLVTFVQLNLTQISLDPSPLSPPVGQSIVPHDLYEVWLSLTLATLLATRDPVFSVLLILTIVLFYPSIKMRAIGIIGTLNIVFNSISLDSRKTSNVQQLEEELENLQEQLALKTQEIEAQQLETLQAKTESARHQESLQQFQEQAQKQIEELRTQLQETKNQLQHTQFELQTTQTELTQSQSQLHTTQSELIQSQSQLHTSQTDLAQLKSYLQQTQGGEGVMNYYRSRIVTNPDHLPLYYQALETQPDDAQTHLQLGNALVRQNRISEAIATYQTALQFHPYNFEIHFELAKTLEKAKQWDGAILAYQRAIVLNPNHSLAHQYLGNALAEQGQLQEASVAYWRALQL